MSEPLVKVHLPGESLWVKVLDQQPNSLTGQLENHPVNTDVHGLQFGDTAEFYRYGDSEWELVDAGH